MKSKISAFADTDIQGHALLDENRPYKGESSWFAQGYTILEKLGEGSGGVVYKAYHKRLKKEVVIKKMRKKSADMQMNRQEADILKNLRHTYLPQVLDFIMEEGEIYTVMSYIPGRSFKELLKEKCPFGQNQFIRWGMQLCSALNYLHSQNPPVIHGDIKPANIMLTPDGNVCLIDFNISFFLDGTTILGYTDGYTSPEQYIIALDQESVYSLPQYAAINEKSDIYSLGATFYHLATGRKIGSHKEIPDAGYLEECTSPAFAKVILKALQIDPADRYQNAYEMFLAFQDVTKKDRRYQSLLKKQRAVGAMLVVLLAGFIVLGGYGIRTLKTERVEKYNRLVKEQKNYRMERDYEREEELFQEARKILPSALESYYQNAYALYEQKEYEECIRFIDYDIFENEKADLLDGRMADICYLKADSHFLLGEYQEAVEAYNVLFQYGGFQSEYYRDYAIALAYNGEPEEAQEVLDEAIEYGLTEDSIYYAKGEIEKSMGQMEEAAEEFKQCIGQTEDMLLKARAYVELSKIYEEKNEILRERDILLEARRNLPMENQMLVLERLIQADVDLGAGETGSMYQEEAIALLSEVISQGWDSYATYDNLVILYDKQGSLSLAKETLKKMEEMFGADYNIFKRYAFLEIDAQELKENSMRDYRMFAQYYEKAVRTYAEERQGNQSDTEMGLLMQVYQQVKGGGWL